MLRKLVLSAALVLALSPMTAVAHEERAEAAHTQPIQAGPYSLTVKYDQWPLRSEHSYRFVIEPVDGLAGKTAKFTWVPAPGTAGKAFGPVTLGTYPGIEGAWALEFPALMAPGQWQWEIEVDGHHGKGVGRSEPFTVLDPPAVPLWLGWILGLFPLYGILWFGGREFRRVKAAMAVEGAQA